MKVESPDGRQWTVRRRWLPRWEGRGWERVRRQRQARRSASDRWDALIGIGDVLGEVPIVGAVVTVVAMIVILVLFVAFGLPFLLALADVVLVLLVAVAGAIGRVLFRRPWTVEASSGDTRLTRPVVGWFASGRAIGRWAAELRQGLPEIPADA